MEKFNHFDVNQPYIEENEYLKINPQEGMTIENARDYWDKLFSKEISPKSDTTEYKLKQNEYSKDADSEKDISEADEKTSSNTIIENQETDNTSDESDEPKEINDASIDKINDSDNTSEGEDITENNKVKELTEEEINEKQQAAIKDALERIRNGEILTKEELGNLGEMMMDQYYISKGYKPLNKHRVTSLDDTKGGFKTGIDGVYEKTNPDGTKSYAIADAKYNTSRLSKTNDGNQMSDNWIDKRLDDAVGKEKADEIRDVSEDNPNSVSHEVYHIDPNIDENGNMHSDIQQVDSEGNKAGDKIIVEYFDKDGNRIEPSYEN